jgi:hypothetical protein
MKEDAILAFHVGEFGWELLRFAPHVLWNYRTKYKKRVKLIVCSRQDRYDFYGEDVDVFHPFELDEPGMRQDCFKLTGFRDRDYYDYFNSLVQLYSKKYNIIERIIPKIDNRKYTQRAQFPLNQMDYKFKPRHNNKEVYNFMYTSDKPSIVLAPRYRRGVPRNWPYWKEFYDLIEPLKENYNFVICGKEPDVILDERFDKATWVAPGWDEDEEWSLIGLTIEIIKNSILTIGSQSGIPNLSNILGTPTLQWGNEKHEHTKVYNINNTETIYLDDSNYSIDPVIVVKEMNKFLKRKGLT